MLFELFKYLKRKYANKNFKLLRLVRVLNLLIELMSILFLLLLLNNKLKITLKEFQDSSDFEVYRL